MSPADPIDWAALRAEAHRLTERAYVPYSRFSVGAAALTSTGEIVRGCNVENVSYGLTLCAECGLISDLVGRGAGELAALVVVSGSGEFCTPCGRCRQILIEHAAPDALIQTADGTQRIVDLLPDHFNVTRLENG